MDGRERISVEPLVEALTRREREVLALLEEDLSAREIAERLTIAVSSTKWHIQHIYGKLGVNNRRQAIRRARELGLLGSEATFSPCLPNSTAQTTAGTPLPSGTVTFLFTEIENSILLWESHPRQMSAAQLIHDAALRGAIEANGGVIFKTVGDAFQAAFPTASLAMQAAIAAQHALQAAPWDELGPLKVRMGLHTGQAELEGGDYAAGPILNRAAAIRSAGHGGQILLSVEAAELCIHSNVSKVQFKELGEHRLKGLAQPEHLFQALAPGLQEDFPPLATQPGPKHNLPLELTSFIGREKEIREVSQLVRQHRLVTLTGSGGAGKTRLSMRVAHELLEDFPDGVWFAELAPLADPGLVPQVVAATLGLRDLSTRPVLETLIAFLQGRQALVALDNCEHLIEACAWLADALLRACPRIKLLASSREGLGVAGEMVFHVPSMGYPDPQQLPAPEAFQDFEAARLFVERARAVLPSFHVTGQNARALAEVCQRLDGIPLALELAAARVNLLRVEQIAGRLAESFSLLVNASRPALPRHQTLRATIDWSYQLLTEKERTLLHRLAVFAGGCTLEAAEAVCAGGGLETGEILDLLASLVNQSMVIVERQQGMETRYRLLETVRQYAHEKLVACGQSEILRNLHLDYFLDFTRSSVQGLHQRGRLKWAQKLNDEMDNLRAAIEWSYTGGSQPEAGLFIANETGSWLLAVSGPFTEARKWLKSGLEAIGNSAETTLLRARTYGVLGWLALNSSDWPASREWYEESIRLCRTAGPAARAELSWALWGLAYIYGFGDNDATAALCLVEESVAVARQLGSTLVERIYLAFALGYKARIFYFFSHEEDLALAQQAAEEVLQLLQPSGSLYIAFGLWVLGNIAKRRGEYDQAYQHYQHALTISKNEEARVGVANTHRLMSWLFYRQGDCLRALGYSQQYLNAWFTMGNFQRPVTGLMDCGIFLVSYADQLSPGKQARYLQQAVALFSAARKATGGGPIPVFPEENYDFAEQVELLRARLEAAEFQKAWAEGQGMSLDEAVKFALAIKLEEE